MRTYGCQWLLFFTIMLQAVLGMEVNAATKLDTTNVSQILDSASSISTLPTVKLFTDSVQQSKIVYKPDPRKAVWYSALCPGLGQLYNRRYWKLPFIGAGFVTVAYAIGWNTKYYNAYTNAYRDIIDNDPSTQSYLKLMPAGSIIADPTYFKTVILNRQQKYRRMRDMSYMSAIGVYVISLLDAFVDAQLYDFDISPDLSVTPKVGTSNFSGKETLEFGLAFRF